MNPSKDSVMRLLTSLIQLPIVAYRTLISPVIGTHCRFEPSCSCYALDALEQHGPVRGSWLTMRRLVRCGPWSAGGPDPVPQRKEDK